MTDELKTAAYKITGEAMESIDLMAQAIDADDWRTASDLAQTMTQVMAEMSRMWMGLAVAEREES